MLYILLGVLALLVMVSLLRVRFRCELAEQRRLLFIGLGRSGPELDLLRGQGEFRLMGIRVKRFSLDSKDDQSTGRHSRAPEKKPHEGPINYLERFREPLRRGRKLISPFTRATRLYLLGLLKSMVVEKAEADIEAGFDRPDLTGQMFGYYHALVGAVPALAGRLRYHPDWSGASLSGQATLIVAWPLYRLIWLTVLLVWRLPVRKLYKLTIGDNKGVKDGQ